MSGGERLCLYDAAELEDALDRMAVAAAALLTGAQDPLLLGMKRRGEPIARMLQQRLEARYGLAVPLLALHLKRYGDDLSLLHPETELAESPELMARDFSNATVLAVDDVLYHGHSLVRTLFYLKGRGAKAVHAAVLVDRCVSQFPVSAAVVGLKLQIAPGDVIECGVPPYESRFSVDVLRRGTTP